MANRCPATPLLRLKFPLNTCPYVCTTLSRRSSKSFIRLRDNTVRMYTCGPTVYNYVHIGNFRTFTFQDILRRWLRYRGYHARIT